MTAGAVTFLFTDIEGSTAGLTRLGVEVYAALLEDHHRIIRTSLESFGGLEQETPGDSFIAVSELRLGIRPLMPRTILVRA